jgi:hypothetical protein
VGNLVTDRARIARNYARTWFVLDLISIVPVRGPPAQQGLSMGCQEQHLWTVSAGQQTNRPAG